MLQLYNFRCYEKFRIDLGNKSSATRITLISAPSGFGKSTILNGISYAICGEPKKNIQTLGSKEKAKVIFDDGNMKITREQGKNKLKVKFNGNETLLGDEAQEYISHKYSKMFERFSYFSQNNENNFTRLSVGEKMELLRTLVYENLNIDDINEKIKNKHTTILTNITKLNSNIEQNKEKLNENKGEERYDPISFPFKLSSKCSPSSNSAQLEKFLIEVKKSIEERMEQKDVLTTKIEQLEQKISNLRENIQLEEEDLKQLHIYSKEIKILKQDIINYEKNRDEVKFVGDELILEYERVLKEKQERSELIEAEIELEKEKKNLQESKSRERARLEKNIKSNTAWENGNEDETIKKLAYLRTMLENMEILEEWGNLDNLMETIKKTKNKIKEIKKSGEYICPHCGVFLTLINDSLEKRETQGNVKNIKMMEEELERLKKAYENVDKDVENEETRNNERNKTQEEIETEVKLLEHYLIENRRKDEKRKEFQNDLDNERYGVTYEHILTKVKSLKELIKKLESIKGEEQKEGIYAFKMKDIELFIAKQQSAKKEYLTWSKCIKEKITLLKQAKNSENKIKTKYNEEIEKLIEKNKEKLQLYTQSILSKRKELESLNSNLIIAEKYIRQVEKQIDIAKTKENLEENESKLKIEMKKREKIEEFKKLLRKSETIAFKNMIDNINFHVGEYISEFFENEKMEVSISPTKTCKNGNEKTEINISIIYKGVNTDINSLSGGERQRVDLAFMLAFVEMLNLPILMLDESTNNLDQELTGVIVRGIKEKCSCPNVIIVAHQVVKGLFDNVIEL